MFSECSRVSGFFFSLFLSKPVGAHDTAPQRVCNLAPSGELVVQRGACALQVFVIVMEGAAAATTRERVVAGALGQCRAWGQRAQRRVC